MVQDHLTNQGQMIQFFFSEILHTRVGIKSYTDQNMQENGEKNNLKNDKFTYEKLQCPDFFL